MVGELSARGVGENPAPKWPKPRQFCTKSEPHHYQQVALRRLELTNLDHPRAPVNRLNSSVSRCRPMWPAEEGGSGRQSKRTTGRDGKHETNRFSAIQVRLIDAWQRHSPSHLTNLFNLCNHRGLISSLLCTLDDQS